MIKIKKDKGSNKELLIEICNKCYLNCKFCSSRGSEKKNRFLNKGLITNIINNAKDLNVSVIQLSGGEPFTHPQFYKICKYLSKKNFRFIIYTSGSIKNNNELKPLDTKIIKKLKKFRITSLRFNLQSHIREIHNNLTGSRSYRNTIKSIKRAINFGINCEIHLIPLKKNYMDLDNTLQFLLKLGISKVKFLRFVPHGRGAENKEELKLEPNEYKELKEEFLLLKEKYNDFIEIGSAFNEKNGKFNKDICKKCQIGKNKIVITPDAKVYPCVSTKNFKYFNFNLRKNSLKTILNSDKYKSQVNKFYSLISHLDTGCPTQGYIKLKNIHLNKKISNIILEKSENTHSVQ